MSNTKVLAETVAENVLGYPLQDWIADMRDDGLSWQNIAKELSIQTDNVISVSWETLRVWYTT